MLFQSYDFLIFVSLAFFLYWVLLKRNLQLQNTFLLICSYIFYAWWNWKTLFLLVGVSLINYFVGRKIFFNQNKKRRKIYLFIGLILNICVLSFFKYYNFFIVSFTKLINPHHNSTSLSSLKIILPLGISFYIFLSISYLIDIYKKRFKYEHNIIDVLLSLSFFPIILSGPIHRPSMLIPQIRTKRIFNYEFAVNGCRQILWGLITKVIIADNIANFLNPIFSDYISYSGSTLLLGAMFYSIQIYADFSGYSNMAIGVGKLFGFRLMRNFDNPYFSKDITEFWKKWHISLTVWFRDYVFLPIAYSISKKIKNEKLLRIDSNLIIYVVGILITWLLTGLWHGANTTFVIWGLVHGILLIFYHSIKKTRRRVFKHLGISKNNKVLVFVERTFTLGFIGLSWVIFRSDNIQSAYTYIRKIFSLSLFTRPEVFSLKITGFVVTFFVLEFIQKKSEHALDFSNLRLSKAIRWSIYIIAVLSITMFTGNQQGFIYFQF